MDMEQLETYAENHWRMGHKWSRDEAERWMYEVAFFWAIFLITDEEISESSMFLSELAAARYYMAREEQEANQAKEYAEEQAATARTFE